jgi:type I restriction enzyme S subunit
LEQYKKGVTQKIFNQEIRFKNDNGNDFANWEEKKLETFLIPTLREVNKPDELYLAIGVRSHCKGTFQKPDSEPETIAMDKLYIVKENDLIVNITFAWEGAIAIVKKEDDGGLVSHRFPTYTFNRKISSHNFFRFVFTQKEFRSALDLISPGGAGRNRVLNKKDFLKINVKLPSIPEQEKIADFLSAIDGKIDFVNQQLKKTREYKRGLLQQMFV